MQFSMWTYPWDVQALGIERTCAELRDRAGLNSVSLAASYHAGRFLQPRFAAEKVYYPEDGVIYFRPTREAWQKSRLKPRPADILAKGDVLRQLADMRERTGLGVSAWTVCLHNSRLGLLHPDVTTENAFGHRNSFSLCPSHEDARAYVCALVQDMSAHYRPDSIELETPGFMPYAHGHHHEKDGVGLTAEDDFLLSLCFCPACIARSGKAGVDAQAARARVRTLICEAFERAVPAPRWPDFHQGGLEIFSNEPAILDYVRWRSEPVTSLVAAMREHTHPATRLYVIDILDGWLSGCDTAALARVSDGMIFCAYDMSADETHDMLRRAREAIGPDRYLGAGFRVFWPEMRDAADLAARARAAVSAGADGLNFYNFGLIPAARLDWVKQAVEAAKAAN